MRIVNGEGILNPDIMIIGEAPGKEEEVMGEPFIGKSGKLLDKVLKECEIKREECYITNAIKVNINKPTDEDISNWMYLLHYEVKQINPKIIITLGIVPYKAITQHNKFFTENRSKMINHWLTKDIKLLATYHPSYCLRKPSATDILIEDFKKAAKYVKSIK